MHDAGLAIDANLETLSGALTTHDQEMLQRMIRRIRKGDYLARVMEIEKLPPLDVALVKVGEKTGNLSEVMNFLAVFYDGRAALERSFRRAMMKPFFLFISSLFLRDLPQIFSKSLTVKMYLLKNLSLVSLVVAVVAALFYLYRISNRSREVAEKWNRFFSALPWFGGVVRAVAKERFFSCLHMGLKSGCDLQTMVGIANEMTFLPSLRRATQEIVVRTQKLGFAQAVTEARICTPNELLALKTGEVSGTLDGALKKVTDDLRMQIEGAMKAVEDWLPRIVYALAMIYAVLGIFESYSNQLKELNKVIDKI